MEIAEKRKFKMESLIWKLFLPIQIHNDSTILFKTKYYERLSLNHACMRIWTWFEVTRACMTMSMYVG